MVNQSNISSFAAVLVLIAFIVGCGSEPAKQSQPETASPTPQQLLENELKKADAQASAVVATQDQSPVATDTISGLDETLVIGGKPLSIPKATGSVSPRNDDYHDTENNAIVVLQSPTNAMKDFPRDRRNEVDWVKTLDGGFIEPRADLNGEGEMIIMDMDIVMKNTQYMPYVRFPHIAHTKWLALSLIHI